jgi:NADH-quinone oxidoreductase subunit C
MVEPPNPPEAAGQKPAGEGSPEPLAGDVSRAGRPPLSPPAASSAPPAAGKPAESVKTIAPPSGPPDPPPPADAVAPPFIDALQQAVPGAVTQLSLWVGDWTIIVPAARLLEVLQHLRDAPGALFDFCSDLTASDWPPRPQRFDVLYHLYSTTLKHRVCVKLRAADGEPVPTVSGIWPAANWFEREVFDLFGITFEGHPDLRRILMPDEWQGHPQRKDYPLEGPGELLLEAPLDWLKLRRTGEIE